MTTQKNSRDGIFLSICIGLLTTHIVMNSNKDQENMWSAHEKCTFIFWGPEMTRKSNTASTKNTRLLF